MFDMQWKLRLIGVIGISLCESKEKGLCCMGSMFGPAVSQNPPKEGLGCKSPKPQP